MSSDFRKQIYNNLNQKETDELVEIWQTNDRVEWREETFDVVREILLGRLGELPPQDVPVLEHIESEPEDEIEGKSDNAPVFYLPQEVLWLDIWLNRAAIVAIVASIVSGLFELPGLQRITLSYFMGNNMEWDIVAWLIALVVFIFAVGLQSILIYFPLKALGSILKILMEMEFISRGVK